MEYRNGKSIELGDTVRFNYQDEDFGGSQLGTIEAVNHEYENVVVVFHAHPVFDTFYPEQLELVKRKQQKRAVR